jgi:hypothetical protein
MSARRAGRAIVRAAIAGFLAVASLSSCHRSPGPEEERPKPPTHRTRTPFEVAETVLDGKLGKDWEDWGWGPHRMEEGKTPAVSFAGYGGIILHHAEMRSRFGALVFRFRAPEAFGDFLAVTLKGEGTDDATLPTVAIGPEHVADVEGGFEEVMVPWSALNPSGVPFDRIVIKARRMVGSDLVLLDKIVLTKSGSVAVSTPSAPPNGPSRPAKLAVLCDQPGTRISPLIYGVAGGPPELGAPARRIGGNVTTRLNWDLGTWNTGNDWFFENVGGDKNVFDWIADNEKLGVEMAIVVPMIGWVAKDNTSVGFPRSKFDPERAHDPKRPEAGDGVRPDGKPIDPGPPTQTSIAADPALVKRWIRQVLERDKVTQKRSVGSYILDNEPSLWNVTHRDVHPEPTSYDELLERTIQYGTAIREADPDAVIAGPAEWGWTGYFYSAVDTKAGVAAQPDRAAHGGVPLLPWYLQRLAEHEKKTGVRILDVVDVHFYPQASGVYGNDARTDPETAALRLRSTRALWDPTYRDESWIGEHVSLIPRLRDWIARNYPGRGISIGEWSFGAEAHPSGGLAIAEALGRFGQQGVTSAYYWVGPAAGTPAFHAFRAYRNYDGRGARFLDWSIPTRDTRMVSLFASRDESRQKFTLILLNLDPVFAAEAEIDAATCGQTALGRVFTYAPGGSGITETHGTMSLAGQDHRITGRIPPYSIVLIELTRAP